MPDVDPTPDLADVPMKPAPTLDAVDHEEESVGDNPIDPPADDLTPPAD